MSLSKRRALAYGSGHGGEGDCGSRGEGGSDVMRSRRQRAVALLVEERGGLGRRLGGGGGPRGRGLAVDEVLGRIAE